MQKTRKVETVNIYVEAVMFINFRSVSEANDKVLFSNTLVNDRKDHS